MNEFKPCPFCWCKAPPVMKGNGIGDNWLECTECGASTRLREDGAGSDKDWNQRAVSKQDTGVKDAQIIAIEYESNSKTIKRVTVRVEGKAVHMFTAPANSAPSGDSRASDAASDAREIERLNAVINTPHADDFIKAVSIEAEHQRQRWGAEGDAGKTAADWFWLVGYLAGKALHAHAAGNTEKSEHHVITTAAACANWHRALFGATDMRPGIAEAAQEGKS